MYYRPVHFGDLADVYRSILVEHLRQVLGLYAFVVALTTHLYTAKQQQDIMDRVFDFTLVFMSYTLVFFPFLSLYCMA